MNKEIDKIDEIIKEALTQEEAKFYDELEEQNLFQMLGGLFKGKNSWLALIMNVMNALVFGLLIYCIIQTFDVEKTNDLILWAGGVILCFLYMSMIKIYMWMQLHRNAVVREIKRLELQVSSLSNKISK